MGYELGQYLRISRQVIYEESIKANATISFTQVKTGVDTPVLIEDEVGNMVLGETETEVVSLSCWLVQRSRPMADVQAGINLDSEYFEGRLVEPKTFLSPLSASQVTSVVINGREAVATSLISLETPVAEQVNLKSYLGQRIHLYLQFSQAN